MRSLTPILAFLSLLPEAVSGGCRRTQIPPPPADAPTECGSDAGPPDGGLTWQAGVPASVTPPQSTGWTAVSTDPECTALTPGPLPPHLSFSCPPTCLPDGGSCTSLCGTVVVDGQGDVAVSSWPNRWFFRPDGSESALVTSSRFEGVPFVAPRVSGFVLMSNAFGPDYACAFSRLLGPDANSVPAVPSPLLEMVAPNPMGGYVVATSASKASVPTLWVRWVSASLEPLDNWHAVMTSPVGFNNHWRLVVDQQGRALVLSFVYPQTLGGKPSPETWKFTARWMGANGPLTDEFEPIAPLFKPDSSDRPVLFPGFGTIESLPYGGFALFQQQAPTGSGGTISATGWYAAYPSGEARITSAPSWLQPYKGSLYLLAGGKGYMATQRDPNTCARTVSLISRSGRTCFLLPLEGSDFCETWGDVPWPDGTLVMQTLDQVHWWPGLAGPVKREEPEEGLR